MIFPKKSWIKIMYPISNSEFLHNFIVLTKGETINPTHSYLAYNDILFIYLFIIEI